MEKCPSRAVSGPPHSGDTHTTGLYPHPLSLRPVSPPPGPPSPGPTFVLQAAVGLVAAVLAVVEAVADEAQVDAEPPVAQMLVPGAALCGTPGRRAGGDALRTRTAPKGVFWGRYKTQGVLTLIGGHGTVAGAEARGAHAAVGDEGDAQEVGVGVEGGGHHVAAEPGAPPSWAELCGAVPLLLVELQAVEEAGRRALHAERLHPQLDGEPGGHLDAPDAERVGRVGAGVVGGAEGALRTPQGAAAGCRGTGGTR